MYQCSGCNKYFSHRGPFNKHRVGNFKLRTRHCLTTEEMLALEMQPIQATAKKNVGREVWHMAPPVEGMPVNWSDNDDPETEEEDGEEDGTV